MHPLTLHTYGRKAISAEERSAGMKSTEFLKPEILTT